MKAAKLALLGMLALGAGNARADHPSVHGMLLFGKQATYASHLPLFHPPHDYQVILKLTLADIPKSGTVQRYEEAKAANEGKTEGDLYFTLVPEKMDLTQVIDGTKPSFFAEIYQGHFERGGKRLGPVQVKVDQVVFSGRLDGGQAPSALQRYLAFGEKGEYFVAHLIQEKPSFDLIGTIGRPFFHEQEIPDSRLPVEISRPKHGGPLRIPQRGEELGRRDAVHAGLTTVIYQEEEELSH